MGYVRNNLYGYGGLSGYWGLGDDKQEKQSRKSIEKFLPKVDNPDNGSRRTEDFFESKNARRSNVIDDRDDVPVRDIPEKIEAPRPRVARQYVETPKEEPRSNRLPPHGLAPGQKVAPWMYTQFQPQGPVQGPKNDAGSSKEGAKDAAVTNSTQPVAATQPTQPTQAQQTVRVPVPMMLFPGPYAAMAQQMGRPMLAPMPMSMEPQRPAIVTPQQAKVGTIAAALATGLFLF